MSAAVAPAHGQEHPKLGFIRSYIFSVDHKVIAKQYLWLGIFFLMAAGLFAVMIRVHLANQEAFPILGKLAWAKEVEDPVTEEITLVAGRMPPDVYNTLFTNHGALMIFFAVTPIVIGAFGNFLIPLQVGARDMAFPKLNMMSFWVIFVGGLLMIGAFFLGAAGGWTAYPPLSARPEFTEGWGGSFNLLGLTIDGVGLWLLGISFAGTSSLMGGINYIATVLNLRAKGMTLMRLPLATWGLFFTSVLNVLWVPVVAVALFEVFLDRVLGANFYNPEFGGQPLLYQHLFWGFGHPEVYILIFPVWGWVGDLLSVFSRKPAFGYKATVISMGSIVVLSQVVWGHHMFTSGMNPNLGHWFVLLTITVSVPTAIFFLNWLATLWGGAIRFSVPMLFALAVVFVFAIGGLTGLFLALQDFDIYVHDTAFVVAHFHYTLAASVLFGAFAGIYYWYPKLFGRMMNHAMGVVHFALSFVLLNCVFFPMFFVGLLGQRRRVASGTVDGAGGIVDFMAYAAVGLGLAQLLFAGNFLFSLFFGKRAERNPWQATSLEWVAPTPLPHENFETDPVVYCGPHEFSNPASPDRDWIMQTDPAGAEND